MADPLRIVLAGSGRMGSSIAAEASRRDGIEIAATWERGGNLEELARAADVVIDFTLPEATGEVLAAVVAADRPLVCGVSGHDDAGLAALEASSSSIPVVYDRNMSQGITLLDVLLRSAAGALGPEFSVSIAETHHVHKKDAPSGTALKLGEAITAAGGVAADEIRYSSARRGEVPGVHTVTFESPTEKLSFEHSVTTRDVFAVGALRAARWVAYGRAPGLYSMRDVLFGE